MDIHTHTYTKPGMIPGAPPPPPMGGMMGPPGMPGSQRGIELLMLLLIATPIYASPHLAPPESTRSEHEPDCSKSCRRTAHMIMSNNIRM